MLEVKVKEGILKIDDEKIRIEQNLNVALLENIMMRIANIFQKRENKIFLKDISLVVYERGIIENICPHIIVYYKDHSRLIEFCVEQKLSKKKTDFQKVLDFFEEKGIGLGVAVST